ncbi:uncharacterized protein LOC125672271 [Ostrea edulis]|uniref:uncharacterized protein LOC125672271 n=1 Tax=Ostrea edulis TaxID=37623 RepID=UPI002094DC6D|nr:uncharacterized protein LOC125672271 [Ostrea edulis]
MPSHPFHHMTLLLALIGGISSCSSPGVVTLNDKTQYSDVIVAGTISSKVRDGVYSMLVDCVLKDSNVDIPASLNISGVETEEGGMCFVSEISVAGKFVVFLSSYYTMRFKEQPFEDYSEIVKTGCDLKVKSKEPLGDSKGVCENVIHRACPTTTRVVHTRRTKRPRKTTTTTPLSLTTRAATLRPGSGSVSNGPNLVSMNGTATLRPGSNPVNSGTNLVNGAGSVGSQTEGRLKTDGMGRKNGASHPDYNSEILVTVSLLVHLRLIL